MRKCKALFALFFITFLILVAKPAFAKKVTLSDLGQMVDASVSYEPDYIYVIGNYVFTQDKELTTQDVMLSARTIDVKDVSGETDKDDIYGEMTIHRLDRVLDESYKPTGNWVIGENLVGKTIIDEGHEFDIKYVDYIYQKDNFTVTFEYPDGGQSKMVNVIEGEKVIAPEDEPEEQYHKFMYWANEGSKYNFEEPVVHNLLLEPYWNLYSDEFVDDVVENLNTKEEYEGKIYFDKQNSDITFDILQADIPISTVSSKILPGILNYVFQKGEITELDLNYPDKQLNVQFTNNDDKEELVLKTSNFFDEIVDDKLDPTLDDLAKLEDANIELSIADHVDSVELASDEPSSYTISFDSDFRVADSEQELNELLSDPEVSSIKLGKDISVNETITISRPIEIDGQGYTISMADGSANNNYIFDVQSKNVEIHDMGLKSATKAGIIVKQDSQVTSYNLDVSNNKEYGIEVQGEFTYNVHEGGQPLKCDDEDYNHPAIKVFTDYKNSAVIKADGLTRLDDYYNVTKNNEGYDDTAKLTGDNNYYVNEYNSRLYVIAFSDEDAELNKTYVRFCKYNEAPIVPLGSEEEYAKAKGDITTLDKKYKFYGWSTQRGTRGSNVEGKVSDFSSATTGSNLKPFYYAIYLEDSE